MRFLFHVCALHTPTLAFYLVRMILQYCVLPLVERSSVWKAVMTEQQWQRQWQRQQHGYCGLCGPLAP